MRRILPEGSTDLEQVLWLTIAIVLGMLAATAFSVSMSRRDAVALVADRLAAREDWTAATRHTTRLLAVLVVTPLLMVVWAAVLTMLLALLLPEARLAEVATIAAAIIAATRILAYTAPSIARVLADVVPLAFIVLLLTGVVGTTSPSASDASYEITFDLDAAVIIALVVLELVLRAGAWWVAGRRRDDGAPVGRG
jgi:hypothetical protein